MFRSIFYSLLISVLVYFNAFSQDAKEFIKKADQLMRANSSYAEFKMEIIKTDWSRTYGMKAWALEPDYSLIYVTEPARDKGTVTLKRKKEVWNWIPSVQKVIKIPPSMMLQSWMGSDFTNDDLVKESSVVTDYEHTILREEEYEGYNCYIVESIPKPEAGVVWGKLLTWVSIKEYFQLKTEFYDEDGTLVKTYIGTDIKELGGRKIPTHWEMIPEDRPGEKTEFDYIDIKFNIDVNESFFSEQNMKRVR